MLSEIFSYGPMTSSCLTSMVCENCPFIKWCIFDLEFQNDKCMFLLIEDKHESAKNGKLI